jgi:DNA-binding transcriptional regulator YhcF (GntR family)
VLLESIEEVYFSDPDLCGLNENQLKYSCVASFEGAGRPLRECAMVTVALTLFSDEDDSPDEKTPPSSELVRQRRMTRIAGEAKEQGGLLSQEDLAKLLMCDVRTIRRSRKALADLGVVVPTRGQQNDIGPGVTHKELAIRLWLDGLEPVAVADKIKHSIGAVENYLEKFKRVSYLRMKGFDDFQIALTTGISVVAAKTFSGIHEELKTRSFFKNRMEEINIVGAAHYEAEDEKKDSTSSNVTSKKGASL